VPDNAAVAHSTAVPEGARGPRPDLRVLLVLAESTGGIGRHVRALARGLPGRGIGVTVCGPPETLTTVGLDALEDGFGTPVRVVAAPIGGVGPAALLTSSRALAGAAADADLVHAHGLRAGAVSAAFARRAPLVVTWHNAPLGGRLWRLRHAAVARYVARSSALTLAASDDLGQEARAAGAEFVVTSYVSAPTLPAPTREVAELRADLGVGERAMVLAVGRLQRQKRLDVLVDAAGGWVGDPASPVVVIAGEGPERGRLESAAAASGAPVMLLGQRDDVADLFAAADVVALPSEWEARSLVAQEALRSGVPLVTTSVGGLPALVGEAAAFVAVGDAEALRLAIERVLADDAWRERLTRAGLARSGTWPDEATNLDQIASRYRDLLRRLRSG
jgi:glycosyltransferase involved in cell wall biosynthesis